MALISYFHRQWAMTYILDFCRQTGLQLGNKFHPRPVRLGTWPIFFSLIIIRLVFTFSMSPKGVKMGQNDLRMRSDHLNYLISFILFTIIWMFVFLLLRFI